MAIPEIEVARVRRALSTHCEKVPLAVRDQLSHDFRIQAHVVELFERRPHYREPGRVMDTVVAQFKYTAARRSWTLYWFDRNNRWHKYENFVDKRDFIELLREVEADPTGIFWG